MCRCVIESVYVCMAAGVVRGIFTPASIMTAEGPQVREVVHVCVCVCVCVCVNVHARASACTW